MASSIQPISPAQPLIPKLFHQISWNGDVPEHLQPYQASLLRYHMDGKWQWRGWNKDQVVSFIEEHYQPYVGIFRLLKYPYQAIQLARYFILYHFGGIIVDLDLEFFQNIGDYLKGAELVLVRAYPNDWMNFAGTLGQFGTMGVRKCSTLLSTKWMASRPKNPFWLAVIQNVVPRVYQNAWFPTMEQEVHHVSGSYVLTDTFVQGGWAKTQKLILMPSSFMEPCKWAPVWKMITGYEGPCMMNDEGEWTANDPQGNARVMKAIMKDHNVHDWSTNKNTIPLVLGIVVAIVVILVLHGQVRRIFRED